MAAESKSYGTQRKKIILVPNYLYISLPDFAKLVRSFPETFTGSILYLDDIKELAAEEYCEDQLLACHNLPHQKLQLQPAIFHRDLALGAVLGRFARPFTISRNLLIKWCNYRKIRRWVEHNKPDLLIVTSDLGPQKVRFLMESAKLNQIPVVIFYSFDVPDGNNSTMSDMLCSKLDRFSNVMASFVRANVREKEIVGSYNSSATICVVSESTRQKLVEKGIPPYRIKVVQAPVPMVDHEQVVKVREKLEVCSETKVVLFFTECIECIYGMDYLTNLYSSLAGILAELAEQEDILFVIKLHPRESKTSIDFVRNTFTGRHVRILDNYDVEELIAAADLSLAHFSKVLITAALMGKPFLSLNLLNDRKRTFIKKQFSEEVEVHVIAELGEKIINAISDGPASSALRREIVLMSSDFLAGKDDLLDIINMKLCQSEG